MKGVSELVSDGFASAHNVRRRFKQKLELLRLSRLRIMARRTLVLRDGMRLPLCRNLPRPKVLVSCVVVALGTVR